ncbi:MAG: hypothetical protein ACR2GA_05605 [Chloroflexota bacterium]
MPSGTDMYAVAGSPPRPRLANNEVPYTVRAGRPRRPAAAAAPLTNHDVPRPL